MSVVRRWAKRLSRRRCAPLLARCSQAPAQSVHDLTQSSIAGFRHCKQCGTGFVSEAFPPVPNARSLCSSTIHLRQVESAVECLNIADPEVDCGRASMTGGTRSLLSSHVASMDVCDMREHQSVPLVTCNRHKTDSQRGALPFQENTKAENKTVAWTSLICDPEEDSSLLGTREDTSYDEQNKVAGLKSADAKDDVHLGNLSGSSKPVLSAEDEKLIQNTCTFLDSKAWDVDTEEYLSKNFTPHCPHVVVAMVISRQKRRPVAMRFFEWACKEIGHDSYCYHALLLKLGQDALFEEMWEVVRKMKVTGCQVSETTFCILIKAYGAACMPDMAVTAFQRMSEYGVGASIHAHTTLIGVFFRLKLLDEAHLCFNKLVVDGVKLDNHLFSTLIRGFGVMRNLRDAQACFDMMLSHSLVPDLSIFESLIEGFCCCNAMQNAMTTLAAMQKRGLEPKARTFNLIVKTLCKSGKLDDALDFFNDMKGRHNFQPNQATYNTLLLGMLAAKDFHKALVFFKQMENEGFSDAWSYILLSSGLQQTQQTLKSLNLLSGLFDVHGFSNVKVCNALIHNLSHLGALDDAENIFRGMVMEQKHPSIPSYAIMISCYCRAQKLEEAIELLAELRGRGCVPSTSCYRPIISLLLGRDRATDALRYVQEMQHLGLEVKTVTYGDLLKVLCKQGMLENAMTVCQTMIANGFMVNTATLFELMKCLVKLQGVEAATSCFRELYKEDAFPKCKAVSQALAVMNLYSHEY